MRKSAPPAKTTIELLASSGPRRTSPVRPAAAGHRFTVDQAGPVRVTARATDGNGVAQPRQAAWNPSGYLWNACHAVAWTVRA